MNKDRLEEIGSPLGVTDVDILSIRKKRFREKWFYPITGAFVVGFTTLLGYLVGNSSLSGGGYPYSVRVAHFIPCIPGGALIPSLFALLSSQIAGGQQCTDCNRKRKTMTAIALIFIVSILGFLWAHDLASESGRDSNSFGEASDYGVYFQNEEVVHG